MPDLSEDDQASVVVPASHWWVSAVSGLALRALRPTGKLSSLDGNPSLHGIRSGYGKRQVPGVPQLLTSAERGNRLAESVGPYVVSLRELGLPCRWRRSRRPCSGQPCS